MEVAIIINFILPHTLKNFNQKNKEEESLLLKRMVFLPIKIQTP